MAFINAGGGKGEAAVRGDCCFFLFLYTFGFWCSFECGTQNTGGHGFKPWHRHSYVFCKKIPKRKYLCPIVQNLRSATGFKTICPPLYFQLRLLGSESGPG